MKHLEGQLTIRGPKGTRVHQLCASSANAEGCVDLLAADLRKLLKGPQLDADHHYTVEFDLGD